MKPIPAQETGLPVLASCTVPQIHCGRCKFRSPTVTCWSATLISTPGLQVPGGREAASIQSHIDRGVAAASTWDRVTAVGSRLGAQDIPQPRLKRQVNVAHAFAAGGIEHPAGNGHAATPLGGAGAATGSDAGAGVGATAGGGADCLPAVSAAVLLAELLPFPYLVSPGRFRAAGSTSLWHLERTREVLIGADVRRRESDIAVALATVFSQSHLGHVLARRQPVGQIGVEISCLVGTFLRACADIADIGQNTVALVDEAGHREFILLRVAPRHPSDQLVRTGVYGAQSASR